MRFDLKRATLPWLWALASAAAFCACYPMMYCFRKAWQAHYPQLAGQWGNNGSFAVIGWFGTEMSFEELGYAARVNDAAHHLIPYDPYIRSNRNLQQFLIDRLSYSAVAAIQLFVRNINWTWVLTRFLCNVAWFIFIYLIALRVTESSPVAIFFAAFVANFSYILTLLFIQNLHWHQGLAQNLWTVFSYGRTEGLLRILRPGVTYAFLFWASLWFIKTAERRTWKWSVLSGVLGGALAYVHLDSWSIYLVAAGIYAGIALFTDRKLFQTLAVSVAISTILSLPFLYSNYPPNKELVYRGLLTSQLPPSFYYFSIIYGLVFCLGLKYSRKPVDFFLTAMAGSALIMTNIGFLMGYLFEPDKWAYIANIYIFLWAGTWIPQKAKSYSRSWLAAAALLIAMTFSQGLFYAAIHYPFQGIPQDYSAALAWLNGHTSVDSEVLSLNPEIEALIPAYTHDKTSLALVLPEYSNVPLIDNYERLLGGLRLFGINPDWFIKDCLLSKSLYDRRSILDTGLIRGSIEKSQMHTLMFYQTPEWYVEKIMNEGHGHPVDLRPDYIWYGRLEKEYAPKFPSSKTPWREVYRNASVVIYGRTPAR